MDYQRVARARRYLYRFDQILDEMAEKMLNPNIVNNITLNFIECMIPHHQAAIYMSENLLRYTYYRPLQTIANNIIQMQTTGIEQMRQIASTTSGFSNMPRDVEIYMARYFEITKDMLDKMKNSPRCVSINLDFVNEMIPHHKGAIAMCENLLQYRIDPRLKHVADTIIREQSQGVRELTQVQRMLCSS